MSGQNGIASRKLSWTGKKKWLYQLSYAVAKSCAVNNGEVTVIEVATALGQVFNIDLKNIYRGNMEDRISKESGDGLRLLLEVYLKDIDFKDLHPKGRE